MEYINNNAKMSSIRHTSHTLAGCVSVTFDEFLEGLSANLVAAIQQSKLSQNELAKKAGVDQSTVSALLNGQGNPTVKTLFKLASALGMGVYDLMPVDPDAADMRAVAALTKVLAEYARDTRPLKKS